MFFRYRRYRLFLAAAFLLIFLVFRFSQPAQWEATTAPIREHLHLSHGNDPLKGDKIKPPPLQNTIPKPTQKVPADRPLKKKPSATISPNGNTVVEGPENARTIPQPQADGVNVIDDTVNEGGGARWEEVGRSSQVPLVRWSAMPEHFPVPTESLQPLPTGKPKALRQIQAKFKAETSAEKEDRERKLNVVKEHFVHAWKGYKAHAWGSDEVKPVSGNAKNVFNGWAATLVDSLDTMWMMGLKGEFEEAVDYVKKLDFHTSSRSSIPLFETVIRYLGGLIGAYDVSDGKYPILLEKAVELGDVLMGAFDTPNRMPQTYYQWRPAFASQPHRAPSRVVLAEIGSLQMEFTRLAQLTKNNTYYDAVARIIDELEAYQSKTLIPGLWPTDIDTSGCLKTVPVYHAPSRNSDGTFTEILTDGSFSQTKTRPHSIDEPELVPIKVPPPLVMDQKEGNPNANGPPVITKNGGEAYKLDTKAPPQTPNNHLVLKKRQVQNVPSPNEAFQQRHSNEQATTGTSDCTPGGLDSVVASSGKYTFGSTADSAFEYLSKQYMLLGGLVEKYKTMFEKSLEVGNEALIFRAMIPDEKREILISGTRRSWTMNTESEPRSELDSEGQHLTCFAGGMYAMGGKLFDRPEWVDIGAKLTDGCVWAYESTTTGIMPETFQAVICESRASCAWNESKWLDSLDPNYKMRMAIYEQQLESYNVEVTEREAKLGKTASKKAETPANPIHKIPGKGPLAKVTEPQDSARSPPKGFDMETRRKQMEAAKDKPQVFKRQLGQGHSPSEKKSTLDDDYGDDERPTKTEKSFNPPEVSDDAPPPIWSPTKPETREEYAQSRIKNERLPKGMKEMGDTRYLLRPEALESVWYMHRITGDPYWRAAGWRMVSSILKATRTQIGHSAIKDVTVNPPKFEDNMESFWLAETLKYAWLLFEKEDKWSLDEWVLNTEAHLFKRPTA